MFREIILSIFRSTRLCVTACDIMHPRCCRPLAFRQVRKISPSTRIRSPDRPARGQSLYRLRYPVLLIANTCCEITQKGSVLNHLEPHNELLNSEHHVTVYTVSDVVRSSGIFTFVLPTVRI